MFDKNTGACFTSQQVLFGRSSLSDRDWFKSNTVARAGRAVRVVAVVRRVELSVRMCFRRAARAVPEPSPSPGPDTSCLMRRTESDPWRTDVSTPSCDSARADHVAMLLLLVLLPGRAAAGACGAPVLVGPFVCFLAASSKHFGRNHLKGKSGSKQSK
ncbi:hypothetical protein BCR33DRAFT_318504 [Rhizoclosmatium globosum]|uniref:Uncharacterized protein n=1 Tax=Rhizoclosmatium globosum TaxID=329046 RepID=A0A1Y2CZL9_9FUNG|nr:hypothetical protein BCR33DRAFT_318504 [Rhizoclosmatium globosum]|eukprot:ORY52471.1 hypothetical protein BCR33DRAFT_318504 [Rhizoclosmatium globosum]